MHTHWARLPAGGGPEAGRGTTPALHPLCTIYDARLQAKQLPKNTPHSLVESNRDGIQSCEVPMRLSACVRATGT